jgi:hypothetical protein
MEVQMADTTYNNQAVYRKQGGDELVIADGGAETIESSGKQTVESGGEVEIQSGGILDLQAGATFTLASTGTTPDELEKAFLSPITVTQYGSVSITGTLSPAYGHHVFSAATGFSLGSMTIPAASKGAVLYLNGAYLVGDGNISWLTVSATGLVVNFRGSDLSSLEMSATNYVKLACTVDGTWNVIEVNNITQRPSS